MISIKSGDFGLAISEILNGISEDVVTYRPNSGGLRLTKRVREKQNCLLCSVPMCPTGKTVPLYFVIFAPIFDFGWENLDEREI